MSNLTVRKTSEQPAVSDTGTEWDPFRRMRALLRWDPFADMRGFSQVESSAFSPAFEVHETKDSYVFKADVPGVKEQDLDISVTGDRITVGGKREAQHQEKTDTCFCYERSYGTFTRSFTLPASIDAGQIQADLKEGVLTIAVPKKPEAQAKRIQIKTEKAKA